MVAADVQTSFIAAPSISWTCCAAFEYSWRREWRHAAGPARGCLLRTLQAALLPRYFRQALAYQSAAVNLGHSTVVDACLPPLVHPSSACSRNMRLCLREHACGT
jgi:hypothetical protein